MDVITHQIQMEVDVASGGTSASSSRPNVVDGHMQRRASSLPLRRPLHGAIRESQVGYVYDGRMLAHSCIHAHPETPERIKVVHDILKKEDLLGKMQKLAIRPAERDEVLLVHNEHLWDKVMAISGKLNFASSNIVIAQTTLRCYRNDGPRHY